MGDTGSVGAPRGARGHAARSHTADVILEAWGQDLSACFEEIVEAVVDMCVDASAAVVIGAHEVVLSAASPESQLLELLDEVIFTMDTGEGVPVAARVSEAPAGGLTLRLVLADRSSVEEAGSVPKAVSRSELVVEETPDGARCAVLVDV